MIFRYYHEDVVERRSDLNGAKVQTLIDPIKHSSLFGINANGTLIGTNGEIISTFEKRFNFTLELLPYPGSYGILISNNSWNGLMRYLVSNEADLSAAKMTHDAGRITDASPGFSLENAYFEVIFWKSLNKGSGLTFFLESFSISTWLTIIGISLTVFILLLVINLTQPKFSFNLQLQYRLLILKALFAKSHSIDEKHKLLFSSSMLLFTISLSGSVIFMAYKGVLTSIIAAQEVTPPFKTLNGLAQISDFKLAVVEGSATNEMRQAIKGQKKYNDIYENFVKPYENIMLTVTESFLEDNRVPHAGLFTVSTLDFYSPMERIDTCDLIKIPMKEFRTATVGWMYPKNSMLQPIFDRFMKKLYRNGVIYKINTKYLQIGSICKDEGYPQAGFDVIGVLFLVLLTGISSSIILAIVEKLKTSIQ